MFLVGIITANAVLLETGSTNEPADIANNGLLQNRQNNNIHAVISIMPGGKFELNASDATEFNGCCIEIYSNGENQNSSPTCFYSERNIIFNNSEIILHGNSHFNCKEEVTLNNSKIIFYMNDGYLPNFEVKNLNIERKCRIRIGDGDEIDLATYLNTEKNVIQILKFHNNVSSEN